MQTRRSFLAGAAALVPAATRAGGPLTVFAAASLQEALTAAGAAWTATSGSPVAAAERMQLDTPRLWSTCRSSP